MRIHDIGLPLTPDLPHYWPGEPGSGVMPESEVAQGAAANLTLSGLAAHNGTRVDAPAHFLPGAPTVATIPLEYLLEMKAVGTDGAPARVVLLED